MKKHKKIRSRKRRTSSRSREPAPSAQKRPPWALIFGLIVCVIVVGVLLRWWLSGASERNRETQETPRSAEPQVATAELTPEEEIAALKAEEMQMAQQLLKDFPRNDVTLAFVGSLYRQHGNNTEAVKLLHKALALNPGRSDVYNALGGIAFTKGSYEEAVVYLTKALEIDASQPGFRSSMAFSLMALGRYPEAIEQLNENIRIFPDSVYSHFLLGQACLQQRDYDDAKKHYLTAIKLDQNYVSAYYGLFTACSRLGQQDEASVYMAAFRKLKAEEMKAAKTRDRLYDDLALVRHAAAGNQVFAARIYKA
ncbi:MAG: tetratricopeptide repeat protein, partial [Phycisphaerales bacterium]